MKLSTLFSGKNKSRQWLGCSVNSDGYAFALVLRQKVGQYKLLSSIFVPFAKANSFSEVITSLPKKFLDDHFTSAVMESDHISMLELARPKVEEEELKDAVRWQLSEFLDFDVSTAGIDTLILKRPMITRDDKERTFQTNDTVNASRTGQELTLTSEDNLPESKKLSPEAVAEDDESNDDTILAVAIQREHIEEFCERFKKESKFLDAVDAPLTAVCRMSTLLPPCKRENQVNGFLVMDAKRGVFVVSYQEELVYWRQFSFASNLFATNNEDDILFGLERISTEIERTLTGFNRLYLKITISDIYLSSTSYQNRIFDILNDNIPKIEFHNFCLSDVLDVSAEKNNFDNDELGVQRSAFMAMAVSTALR